jgi:phage tail sheath gpL-like
LPNGTVDPAQKLPPKTVTPSTIKPTIIREMRDWDKAGWTQDLAGMIASLQVLRDQDNGSRAEIAYDLSVIDHLNQTTTSVSEVSTG